MTQEWPLVPLGEILTKNDERIQLLPDETYKEVTVRLWGKGVTLRGEVAGSAIAADKRVVVREHQFILSRIDARNGAFGLVPAALDGAVVSTDFPAFAVNESRILPAYLNWLSKTAGFVDLCKAASEGTTNRVRLKEDRFLVMQIALPPLDEQRRLVARIEALAAKIEEARGLYRQIESDLNRMLLSAYHSIADNAIRRPMIEVAPLIRRPATVSLEENYQQVSVRSFGRGTFHQPDLNGSDITWQKPYLVKAGDILISNIKAWEGAIAVANASDDGRYGSHRYLTCVPASSIATSRFVCFHLLTREGLYEIGEASPGSADRNRTLSAKVLMQIPIPVPPLEKQMWFDDVYVKVDAVKQLQVQMHAELDALLPSVLDRAFRGEL